MGRRWNGCSDPSDWSRGRIGRVSLSMRWVLSRRTSSWPKVLLEKCEWVYTTVKSKNFPLQLQYIIYRASTNSPPTVNRLSTISPPTVHQELKVEHELIMSLLWVDHESIVSVSLLCPDLFFYLSSLMSWWWVDDELMMMLFNDAAIYFYLFSF